MALVSVPPTSVSFLAACSKPEAFTGNPGATPPVPGIPTSTIDQVLREVADWVQTSTLSDRATLPILQWDEGMQGLVFAIAARRLMGFRNFNPKVGADNEIVALAQEAEKKLEMYAPGAQGKRVTPLFVDSKQNQVTDGIKVTSHKRADWRSCGSEGR